MQKKVSRFYMPYYQTCTTMTCCQVFWFPWCSYGKYWLVQLDKMWYFNWVLGVKGSPPYMVLSITTEEPKTTASGWSTSSRCCVYGKENCEYKYANEASGQHEWTFWGVMSNLARFYIIMEWLSKRENIDVRGKEAKVMAMHECTLLTSPTYHDLWGHCVEESW